MGVYFPLDSLMKHGLLVFFLISAVSLSAQSVLNVKLDASDKGKPLTEVLSRLEAGERVRFFYLEDWMRPIQIVRDPAGRSLQQVMLELFENTDLTFYELHGKAVIIVRDPAKEMQHQELLTTAVREFRKPRQVIFGTDKDFKPGQRVRFAGKITDSKSGEPVSGATVRVTDLNAGVITDNDGRFEVEVLSGIHVVNINYINYDEQVIDLTAYGDGEIAIELEETPVLLEEVVVTDRAAREVTTARMGQTKISLQEIRRLPALLGEVDIVKQIQALPGVTTAGEAASGFNVRGGSVDQNLVLFDGVPVFNTSHAFGFFSAFNSGAIRDVTFYRGGIPAEFGGRASSVLDLSSADGDPAKWQVNGGIGLISTQLQAGGPVIKEKTSVAASIRTTYSDWLARSIRTNYADLSDASVAFYDGTFKISHRFSDKARLSASVYRSHDAFRLAGDSSYAWNNQVLSLRFDKTFSPSFQATFSAGSGQYGYLVNNREPETAFDLSYRITYPTAKADFTWQGGVHKISFGSQATWYNFDPGRLEPGSGSSIRQIVMPEQRSAEFAVYAGDGLTIGERFFLELGARYSMFKALGPASEYTYAPGLPLETINQTGKTDFSDGEVVKAYTGLEPRASLRFSLSEKSSIKAGAQRAYQYLHLISNTTAVTPIDIWLPSGTYFKPQYADQVSLGFYRTMKDKTIDAFVEGFYKQMNRIVDFKDGARLILNDHIETDLLQGAGKSYGIEFSVTKTAGRLQGQASYTWSRSLRTINGPTEREKINQGFEYPSNFDQPHALTAQWRYGISRRIFFTGNFTFRSGRPVSAPYAGYIVDNVAIGNFSERNQFRIPDYHRLDLGVVLEGSHRRNKKISGSWTLSAVNVYSRRNPYSVFFQGQSNGIFDAYKISVIGTIIPSLTYSFKI